jgi:hypothetical protein
MTAAPPTRSRRRVQRGRKPNSPGRSLPLPRGGIGEHHPHLAHLHSRWMALVRPSMNLSVPPSEVVMAHPARHARRPCRRATLDAPHPRGRTSAVHVLRGQLRDTIPSKRDETRGKNNASPRRRSALFAGQNVGHRRILDLLAMQKVVGSSPISRLESPANRHFCRSGDHLRRVRRRSRLRSPTADLGKRLHAEQFRPRQADA